MTHGELVKRAARWLKKTVGCGVVFVEHAAGREFPDALGYRNTASYLVECKVSRSDFLADLKKPTRASYEKRPALHCWYLTPPDLLWARTAEREPVLFRALPDGWGLLEVNERAVIERIQPRIPRDHWGDDRTAEQVRVEMRRFYYEVRRYQAQGITYLKLADFVNRNTQSAPTTTETP